MKRKLWKVLIIVSSTFFKHVRNREGNIISRCVLVALCLSVVSKQKSSVCVRLSATLLVPCAELHVHGTRKAEKHLHRKRRNFKPELAE